MKVGDRIHNTREYNERTNLMYLDGGITCGTKLDILDVMAAEERAV